MSHDIVVWGVMGGGGVLGFRLENVQMAGRNGSVLIACLQPSHRLHSVAQTMFHHYKVLRGTEDPV